MNSVVSNIDFFLPHFARPSYLFLISMYALGSLSLFVSVSGFLLLFPFYVLLVFFIAYRKHIMTYFSLLKNGTK